MRTRRLVTLFLSAGLIASALTLGVAPAQAGEGIGSGRALIHIDAPTAKVVKTGKDSYRVVLSPDSSGQWMGARTDARGVTRTRVGDLTAKQLSGKWSKFRYTSAGVDATLAWSTSDGPASALVRLSRPRVTDSGVRFDFRSESAIPRELRDVSINLQRAPDKRASRTSVDFQIADDFYIEVIPNSWNDLSTRLFDYGSGSTCWPFTAEYKEVSSSTGAPATLSVSSGTCDSIKFQNLNSASSTAPANGLVVDFPTTSSSGSLSYYLVVTVPGQDPYDFSHTVLTWPRP